MKAMIFAAGKGTRLIPLTKMKPKCLVEVAGKTMLEHVVERLKTAHVHAVMINVHHFADRVTNFVKKKQNFGIDVSFSYEKDLLDTGGGLRKVKGFFGENAFFVHNSDIYSDLNLKAIHAYHTRRNAVATLAVSARNSSRYLHFDQSMQLLGWENTKTGEEIIWSAEDNKQKILRQAFNGIHVLSPRIFEFMNEESEKFSIIQTYLKAAKEGYPIIGYPMDDFFWMDMGSPAKLSKLKQSVKKMHEKTAI